LRLRHGITVMCLRAPFQVPKLGPCRSRVKSLASSWWRTRTWVRCRPPWVRRSTRSWRESPSPGSSHLTGVCLRFLVRVSKRHPPQTFCHRCQAAGGPRPRHPDHLRGAATTDPLGDRFSRKIWASSSSAGTPSSILGGRRAFIRMRRPHRATLEWGADAPCAASSHHGRGVRVLHPTIGFWIADLFSRHLADNTKDREVLDRAPRRSGAGPPISWRAAPTCSSSSWRTRIGRSWTAYLTDVPT